MPPTIDWWDDGGTGTGTGTGTGNMRVPMAKPVGAAPHVAGFQIVRDTGSARLYLVGGQYITSAAVPFNRIYSLKESIYIDPPFGCGISLLHHLICWSKFLIKYLSVCSCVLSAVFNIYNPDRVCAHEG